MELTVFDNLNEKQKEAVTTTEGRVRIIAGAGSGKTRVLVNRYVYLVEELGIDPSNILCMTFTNKAAQEMKNRIAKLVMSGNVNDFVCTIHGFCVKFLRKEIYRIGYPKNFAIIDEEDSKALAKQVMEELGVERTTTTVKKFLNDVHKFKNTTNKSFEYKSYLEKFLLPQASLTNDEKSEPYIKYILLQLKLFALDFTDLIHFTLYILVHFEDARKYWQNELNYIQIDEVQDCNALDWALIETFSEKYNNLFVVGDPDQAIYEWRGGRTDLFIKFKSDTDIVLNENYRSTPNILNVANSIISNNESRIKKDLFTKIAANRTVLHFHGKTENDEAEWIVKQIEGIVNESNNYGDFAILYRASYLSRTIEQALLRKKISYTVWGGVRFFERKEIKDALSYLRLIAYKDNLSFMRIINVPSRKFGKASLDKLTTIANNKGISLYEALLLYQNDSAFNKKSIHDFISFIEDCIELKDISSISDLMEYVLAESGLKDMLRTDGDEERLENISELQNSIIYYEKANVNEDISLETYMQDIALYTNADYKNDTFTVKLMTVHQAKGLEFPFVFVCGLSEGIFPNHRSIRERKKMAEEEERRLMYVAVTRAEKALFLTDSEGFNMTTHTDKYPSRFLTEIKENLLQREGILDPILFEGTKSLIRSFEKEINLSSLKFETGDTVVHKIFGEGTIIDYNQERDSYNVQFGETTRNVRTTFLEKVEHIEKKNLNSNFSSAIGLMIGDIVHNSKGYGVIKKITANDRFVFFFDDEGDTSEEWISKGKYLEFVFRPKKDCFYKSNNPRKKSFFYVKYFICEKDSMYFCGVNNVLGLRIALTLYSITKYVECTEEEFKKNCPDIPTFEEFRHEEFNLDDWSLNE